MRPLNKEIPEDLRLAEEFGGGSGTSVYRRDKPTYYVIGDVHGHASALRNILKLIKEDIERQRKENPAFNPEIVFMGDYVDRGPHSQEVLKIIGQELASQEQDGIKRTAIKGNHDFIYQRFLTVKSPSEIFVMAANLLNNGGLCTFAELDIFFQSKPELKETKKCFTVREIVPELIVDMGQVLDAQEKMQKIIPPEQIALLDRLVSTYETEDFYFCHAGVDNNKKLDEQNELTLLGINQQDLTREFKRSTGHPDKIVVTGHTIVKGIEFEHTNNGKGGRVSTDTGAYQSGRLSCAILHDKKMIGTLVATTGNAKFEQSFNPTPECKYPKNSLANLSQPLDVVSQQV